MYLCILGFWPLLTIFKDVCCIVKEVSEITDLVSKAGKPLKKRELTLVDLSEFSVRLTLWGKQAETYQADEHAVIAFKGLKVGDYGGESRIK
jgi:replication factor A1